MSSRPVALHDSAVAGRVRALGSRLDALRPWQVVGTAIVVEWLAVLALALVVRHNGWIYYQGGDQLWYYTSGWLLAHGQLGQPLVGYLWSALLAPVAAIAGPNISNAYPAILVFDVAVLLPVAILALYGTARLIAGRRFAYWTLLVWTTVPFIGVLYTNPGYHQRYTEQLLPQSFGLTAMADFPSMVAAIVAAYFTARIVFEQRQRLFDGLAAGVAAGAALGIKPSSALFLVGPLLAFATARRWRAFTGFAVGLLPAVATLALWKWRGYGYLPIVHSAMGNPARAAVGMEPTAAYQLPVYFRFHWSHFTQQLDLLREHFWSGRLLEWLVVAGLIAIGLMSRRALALVGGWFVAFAIVKGGYGSASIEDGSLLRILIPAIPAFVLLLAALPFLLPNRSARVDAVADAPPRLSTQVRWSLLGGCVLVTAVAPFAAIAAATPITGSPSAAVLQQPLIPAGVDLGLHARKTGGRVLLEWEPQRSGGGQVFYHVFRSPIGESAFSCDTTTPAEQCRFTGSDLGTTHAPSFSVDAEPGRWEYRVGVAANWVNDVAFGDVYLLSRPASVLRR